MKYSNKPIRAVLILSIFGGALSVSCSGGGQSGVTEPLTAQEEVAPEAEQRPDEARLLQRSTELWQHKQAGDWIQVYDFLSPEFKSVMPLGKFLNGKENHVYEDASDPLVLKIMEDRGYVEIHVQWTPTHPILSTVDNGDGKITEILDEVDEWVWSEGEWWLAQQHRLEELRVTKPQIWIQDDEEG